MAKFGKYKIAEDTQSGLGAYPSHDTNSPVSPIAPPTIEQGAPLGEQGMGSPAAKVLTDKEIENILKGNKQE
jgi:hypothetical protein